MASYLHNVRAIVAPLPFERDPKSGKKRGLSRCRDDQAPRDRSPKGRTPLKITAWWYALGWLIAASLGTLHAWMLHRYAVDFPLQDDVVQVLAAPGSFQVYPPWREQLAGLLAL